MQSGFNPSVQRFGLTIAYAEGLGLGLAFCALITLAFPGFWLVPAVACCLFLIGNRSRWLVPHLRNVFAVAVFFAMTAGFLLTAEWNPSVIPNRSKTVLIPLALLGACWGIATLFMSARTQDAATKRSVKWFLVVLALFGLVSVASSGTGSASRTVHLLQWLGLSHESAESLVPYIRKSIHFLFYGFVALATYRGCRAIPKARPALGGLLATLTLASFDEIRQSYFASRTGSIRDVALDMLGAVVFVGLIQLGESRKVETA